jgi:hypothetical protein
MGASRGQRTTDMGYVFLTLIGAEKREIGLVRSWSSDYLFASCRQIICNIQTAKLTTEKQ